MNQDNLNIKDKKGVSLIVIIILIAVVVAIITTIVLVVKNNSKESNLPNQEANNNQQQVEDIKKDENKVNTINDELIYTFEDPGYKVAFDYPNMQVIEKNTSRVFRKTARYIIVYSRDEGETALSDIPNKLQEDFTYATSTYITLGKARGFNIDNKKELVINGTNVLQIEGLVDVYDDYTNKSSTLPMVGYTFYKNGISCELIGIVTDEDDGTYYKEMSKYISAMINTLRDDR